MPNDDRWSPTAQGDGRARPPVPGPASPGPPPARRARPPGRVYGAPVQGGARVPRPPQPAQTPPPPYPPPGPAYPPPAAPAYPPPPGPAYPPPAGYPPAKPAAVPYTAPAQGTAPAEEQSLDGGLLGGRSRPIRSHGKRKGRVPVWALIVLVLGLIAVGAGLKVLPGSPLSAGGGGAKPQSTPSPTPPPLPLRPVDIPLASVSATGFLSWSIMDRRTGEIVGSTNMDQTSETASMVKAWLAADYLRRADQAGQTPSSARMNDLEIMIRDSDNAAADRIFAANKGVESIQRMVSVCSLTDSKGVPLYFGDTIMSPRDAVRLGQCIADGRAAGPKWTPYLLDLMRKVRGDGDFGIRQAFPAAAHDQIAIKNGWLHEGPNWYTNCLAIGDTWVLAIMQRFPSTGDDNVDFAHGVDVCTKVTTLLFNPAAAQK